MNEPNCSGSGPDTVPEANRSPARKAAPLAVKWASCCAAVQYIWPNGGCETTVPFHSTRSPMSSPHGSCSRRYSTCCRGGEATLAWRNASSGTTQADTDVANDLPRNGPRGTYSQAWMSRADQSLTSTAPNTWSANAAVETREPNVVGTPTTKPTSASMSSRVEGPYVGIGSLGALRCPHGRTMGVPDTTTVPARP